MYKTNFISSEGKYIPTTKCQTFFRIWCWSLFIFCSRWPRCFLWWRMELITLVVPTQRDHTLYFLRLSKPVFPQQVVILILVWASLNWKLLNILQGYFSNLQYFRNGSHHIICSRLSDRTAKNWVRHPLLPTVWSQSDRMVGSKFI